MQLVLTDLITLGQIGVEVVFAREYRTPGDVAAHREPEANRPLDRTLVEHRQHTGQCNVDAAGLRVRPRAKCNGGARENFRLSRELSVGFQPDDDFPFHTIFPKLTTKDVK